MIAKNIQDLFITMNMCETSLEYAVMFQDFLSKVGHESSEYGVTKIMYETIKVLCDEFDIKELTIKQQHTCNEKSIKTSYVNTQHIIYDDTLSSYKMPDGTFKIFIREPKLDVDTVGDSDMEFINSIAYLEFPDGHKVKLSELSSETPDGGLSEIDTFFSMIDVDVFSEISKLMKKRLTFICDSSCDSCEEVFDDYTDEYISIILNIFKNILGN